MLNSDIDCSKEVRRDLITISYDYIKNNSTLQIHNNNRNASLRWNKFMQCYSYFLRKTDCCYTGNTFLIFILKY